MQAILRPSRRVTYEYCHARLARYPPNLPPMRIRDLRYCLALLFLHPLCAEETLLASKAPPRFGAEDLGHVVLLRDKGPVAPGRFRLPPGGEELGMQPTTSTPYDRYFNSVREVIKSLEPQRPSPATVAHLMKIGYSYQYFTRDPYRPDPPPLTEAQRAGDCKSKALWLYNGLSDPGALLTIGKTEKNSKTSHAWVYWRYEGRWWILDCTDQGDMMPADKVAPDRYVPYYSFGKYGSYRHPAAQVATPPKSSTTTAAVGASDRAR